MCGRTVFLIILHNCIHHSLAVVRRRCSSMDKIKQNKRQKRVQLGQLFYKGNESATLVKEALNAHTGRTFTVCGKRTAAGQRQERCNTSFSSFGQRGIASASCSARTQSDQCECKQYVLSFTSPHRNNRSPHCIFFCSVLIIGIWSNTTFPCSCVEQNKRNSINLG